MDRLPQDTGRIYTATQLFTMTTAPTEVFSLVASSLSRAEIISVELQQNTTTPQAMPVEMYRGSTGGSTGGTITPANREGWPAAPVALAAVSGQSTTPNSTASVTIARTYAGAFQVDSGWFKYEPSLGPIVDLSQRFNVRVGGSTGTGTFQMAATLTFRETGKIL